jgi:hypothetical protein
MAATSWDLFLCETAGPCAAPDAVHMSWTNGQLTTIHINSPTKLVYAGHSGNKGASVKRSSNHLMSATLIVSGATPYYFNCSPSADCVTIAYDCSLSIGSTCQ